MTSWYLIRTASDHRRAGEIIVGASPILQSYIWQNALGLAVVDFAIFCKVYKRTMIS